MSKSVKTTVYLDSTLKRHLQYQAIEEETTISELLNRYIEGEISSTSSVASTKVAISKLHENAVLPQYATEHAAGMDLVACIDEPIILQPHERAMVPTGIAISLPPGYEAQVRGRSGLAIKNGIMPANGVGTIDADYRGEVSALLLNTSNEPFTVEPGMRVAQLVIAKYEAVEWNEVAELDETTRGTGGFGSTGK